MDAGVAAYAALMGVGLVTIPLAHLIDRLTR